MADARPPGAEPAFDIPPGAEREPEPSRMPPGGWDWGDPKTLKDPQALAAMKEQNRQGGILAGTEKAHSIDEYILQTIGTLPLYVGGGAAGLVGKAGPPIARAATAGALARTRGESWPATAIDVGGALVGEAGGSGLRKIAAKLAGPAARETARQAQVGKIGQDIERVLPELAAETDQELWEAAKKWGPVQVERAMKPTLTEIKKRIGPVVRFDVPTLSRDRLSLDAAVEGLKNAPAELKAPIRSEIVQTLNALDPKKQAGDLFAAALKARAAGYTYLGVLGKSLDKSGRVDPEKMAGYINQNYQKLQRYAGEYWPLLENALLGGRKAPVQIAKRPEPFRLLGHRLEAPQSVARGAERALPALKSPGTQAGIDAVLGQPTLSALALQTVGRVAGPVVRHMPGTEGLRGTIREIEEGTE